jgi:hypothetical protein
MSQLLAVFYKCKNMPIKKSRGSLFRHIYAVTIFVLFSFTVNSLAQEETSEVYSVIDWKDLVPASWHRPLIDPDPTEHRHVDRESLASNLDKKDIKMAGYMLPIKFSSNRVSEFILMPYLKHHVEVHVHHEPNQMIYVELSQPLEVTNPYAPIWVSGRLMLESIDTPEGHTGYTLKKATAEEYLY